MSSKEGFFVVLFMKVISGRLEGIVLSVIMLLFQYSLKLSFSSTLAGVYLYYHYYYYYYHHHHHHHHHHHYVRYSYFALSVYTLETSDDFLHVTIVTCFPSPPPSLPTVNNTHQHTGHHHQKNLTTANPQKQHQRRENTTKIKFLSMCVTPCSINEGHPVFNITQIKGTINCRSHLQPKHVANVRV
jgi:Ca2+/Na+ antiporter